ncbi:MAG: TetR/AcrR family transcriptional regulator [Albidovulum sp.]|uniref:TetR/AcrR family transcriptional regulator n=1 Tax=Albidovulum sp. TaxID=1872424 RepID=UPI001327BC07|nr:TetR/AcrR family transcriptional regulator [Defluviimonas sp.]KAB2886436.1 MAG: TetR/AcrR family transcriptional regulator [Defluviimonas sp.]
MTRTYRKSRRAEAQDETRARIVRATTELHVEKGVATTSYPDVAARAGVGAATVYRHFPTMDALVEACGEHFWNAIDPPTPDGGAEVFAGLGPGTERLTRLVEELDAFYERAEAPLWSAVRDQDRVASLSRFLAEVGKGVGAFVAEALREERESDRVRVASAIADFAVWRALSATGLCRLKRREILVAMIEAAVVRAAPSDGESPASA